MDSHIHIDICANTLRDISVFIPSFISVYIFYVSTYFPSGKF